MKTKKLNKKLSFSKSTVADLNSKELNEIQGGANSIQTCRTCDLSCDTCDATCPNTCKPTCYHAPGTACRY